VERSVIAIAGSARRAYLFPAPLDAAFHFNADLDRMLPLLPHIVVLAAPSESERRLCYRATEGGLYRVRIYCTVAVQVDNRIHAIYIRPLDDPSREEAGFGSMSGAGRYESTIRFRAHGRDTRIEYGLKLSARLPTPGSLRLLPEGLVQARAELRFRARLDEILDGFVRRSIAAYRADSERTNG
jgi:hypothetical protein